MVEAAAAAGQTGSVELGLMVAAAAALLPFLAAVAAFWQNAEEV